MNQAVFPTPFKPSHTITRVATVVVLALITLSACSYSIAPFDEPGVRGKVIDHDTKAPLQGVIVYGYYATVEGSIGGGESVKEVLRSFEAETDANGVFELPPWKSSLKLVRGEPRDQFPRLGFYKGGYAAVGDSLTTLRKWYPQGPESGERVIANNGNLYDWTARPQALKKAKTERERYDALRDSSDSVMTTGPCGWEDYKNLLWAKHVEWKAFLQRNIPPDGLDSRGYKKSSFSHPDRDLALSSESSVDVIISNFLGAGDTWRCQNPERLFSKAKQEK